MGESLPAEDRAGLRAAGRALGQLRYLLPAVFLAAGMGVAVAGYEPLAFEEPAQAAGLQRAGELSQEVDAAALEDAASPAELTIGGEASVPAQLADGQWQGYDRCTEEGIFDYYLALTVSVEGGKVTGISNIRGSSTGNAGSAKLGPYLAENDPYIAYAVEGRSKGGSYYPGVPGQIMSRVRAGQGLDGLDAVSGATYSSVSIARAYADALAKSAAAAGAQAGVEEPAVEPAAPSAPDDAALPGISADAAYADGTYTAYAFCQDEDDPGAYSPYYIGVTVTVAGGKAAELSEVFGDAEGLVDAAYRYDAAENLYYLNRAVNGYGISGKHPGVVQQINAKLSAGAAVEGIDTISGATWSSRSIVEAFAAALELAKVPEDAEGGEAADGAEESGDSGAGADEEGPAGPAPAAGFDGSAGGAGEQDPAAPEEPAAPAAAPAPAEDLKTEEAPDEL